MVAASLVIQVSGSTKSLDALLARPTPQVRFPYVLILARWLHLLQPSLLTLCTIAITNTGASMHFPSIQKLTVIAMICLLEHLTAMVSCSRHSRNVNIEGPVREVTGVKGGVKPQLQFLVLGSRHEIFRGPAVTCNCVTPRCCWAI